MSAARLVRHARRGARLSQRALAEGAGVPQSTVARIETGVLSPRVDTLERLLRAAGRTLSHERRTGAGVDRTLIHERLKLTHTRLARLAAGDAAGMARLDRAVGRVVSPSAFDPVRLLIALGNSKIRSIVIGTFAGNLHGSTLMTTEVNVCVATDPANLVALADVLRSIRAEPSGRSCDTHTQLNAVTLASSEPVAFETDAGQFAIIGRPAGTAGFEELERTAERMEIDAFHVLVASLEDLMRIKRAAGRPVDLIELEVLGAVYEEIDRV
jgi:transcriptional regulator with XRE-family HTH domain